MKGKSTEEITKEQAPDQRITMRYLIEDPIVGWRMFPVAKAMLAYRSGLQLPDLAGRTIRVVLALVILEGRKVREIHRLEPSEWKLDSEGRIDRDELMRRIQQKLDAEPGQATEVGATVPQLSDTDVSAIRRCLRLPERGSRSS